MKVVIPNGTPSRTGSRSCEAADCVHTTREGKPFCSDHVDHNPYAKQVIAEIDLRETDDEKAKKKSKRGVNTDGVTATELLQNVADHGPRTKERLCRELNIEMKVLDGYVDALRKDGKITLGRTRRGSEVVHLAG